MNIDPNDPRLTAFVLGELDADRACDRRGVSHRIVRLPSGRRRDSNDDAVALASNFRRRAWLTADGLVHAVGLSTTMRVPRGKRAEARLAPSRLVAADHRPDESDRGGNSGPRGPGGAAVRARSTSNRSAVLDQAAAAKALWRPNAPSPENLNL